MMDQFKEHCRCQHVIRKFYGPNRNFLLLMITEQGLADTLSRIFTLETQLVEYSSTGVEASLLRQMLAQVGRDNVMPKRDSLSALQSF